MGITVNNDGDVTISGNVTWTSNASTTLPANSINNAALTSTAAIARTKLAQDTDTEYPIPFNDFRVWDNFNALLPNASATDDLGLVMGTFGTDMPVLDAGDVKGAGAITRRARAIIAMPAEYDDAETAKIRIRSATETTVADTSCTIDVEAYLSDGAGAVGSDLCTTAATSMNSTSAANYDFDLTSTSLVSGSLIDLRITIAVNDGSTVTVVKPTIYAVSLLCDVRG